MRNLVMAVLLAAVTTASPAFAKHSGSHRSKSVSVKPYTTRSGKSVSSHRRSAPR